MGHSSSESVDYLECDFLLRVQILGCEDGSDQESEGPSETETPPCTGRYQLIIAARTLGEIVNLLRAHQMRCSVCSSSGTADFEAGVDVDRGGSSSAGGGRGAAWVGKEVCDAGF